jgi:branched-chain amino acid transport system substrate-binding protein
MRQLYRTGLMILLLASPFSLAWGERPWDASRHSERELRVGVLASLTGTWSSLGQNTVAALEIAAGQIEAADHSRGDRSRVRLYVYDTQLDPALALQDIKELDRLGVNVIVGPQSSAEVAMIKPYADRHNILVISQGSTASSLSIPGDNIFRMCPDDTREAAAIVALMWHDGIRTVVPLWRDDTGNQGLHDSVQTAFQNLGGTVTTGYRYEPTTTDFSAATAAINSQVAGARLAVNASTIGVYLAAFDEVVGVFQSAQADPTLATTAWYGSDGVALSAALVDNSEAAAFATTVGYPNPIFGLEDSLQSKWQPVADAIQARTGIEPDAYALSTYDALFIVHLAAQEAGGTEDFRAFKAAFVHVADTYTGVTGSTALDAAGDRAAANFDFWAVQLQDNAYTWVRVGGYNNGTLF